MDNMMSSIASASMSMSEMEFENAYDIAVMKKSMDMQAAQAEALINEMLAAVPVSTPSAHGLDVYA